MRKIAYRLYQNVLRVGMLVLNIRQPEILKQAEDVGKLLKGENIKCVLLITDQGLAKIGLYKELVETLNKSGIKVHFYSNVVSNPTIQHIEEALQKCKEVRAEAIIGFGGGSPIDVAKITAARIAHPNKSVLKMKGLLKLTKKLPLLIAVPTTAGAGSEATLAAVIIEDETRHKYTINDPKLVPQYALLDPTLTLKLPKKITAETGVDALTHAIEAYIGRSNTKLTKAKAKNAIKLIFENLETAYNDGSNLEARRNMQIAAYDAGVAFTRAYVGYVHALSHPLSGTYGTAHGLANAVILPIMLRKYGSKIDKKLAELAYFTQIVDENTPIEEAANAFREHVQNLNDKIGIPRYLPFIKDEDIPRMVSDALKEANPLYPVPVIYFKEDFIALYKEIRGDNKKKE
jgi:alcohol dehydrogenase class IV